MAIETIAEFHNQARAYVALFNEFGHKHVLYGHIEPDHICYRCGSHESYERIKALFPPPIDESMISQRLIAYIHLDRWIDTMLGPINYLELQDQKPDHSQIEGFHHLEAYPVDGSYEQLVEKLARAGEEVRENRRPHHTTHEIALGDDKKFLFCCTREPLIDKLNAQKQQ